MNIRRAIRKLIPGVAVAGGLLLAGFTPGPLSAQNVDSRWLPWLGCWEAAQAGSEGPLLCIQPAEEPGSVELFTWSEGTITSSEIIAADGVPREADREGCAGVEEAEFSQDGRRVFLSSQYLCEGGGERNITGLLAMVNPMEWVDIKGLEGDGNQAPWILRYRMARTSRVEEAGLSHIMADRVMAIRTARISASAPLDPQDLIEASKKVDSSALEALIVEVGEPFDVDADMLMQLADAGVPESVIDVAVAVSFPNQFALEPRGPEQLQAQAGQRPVGPMKSFGLYPRFSFWNPYFLGSPYSYYGYSNYGYAGFGYPYGGGYFGLGGYYRPTTIIVEPRSQGRFIKGGGYSRSGSSSGRGAATRGSSGGSGTSTGSGAVRSSGGSSGGSSSSGGRRAVRRGGGGGGGI